MFEWKKISTTNKLSMPIAVLQNLSFGEYSMKTAVKIMEVSYAKR